MSLRRLLTQEATVVSRPFAGVDEYGNPTMGPEVRVAYPARLEQTGSEEITTDRDTVISDWRIFFPPEAVISALDRVEVEGEAFEVVGRPARQRTPRGLHHVEARLRVVA